MAKNRIVHNIVFACLILIPTVARSQEVFHEMDTIKNFSSYKRSLTFSGLLQTRYIASTTKNVDVNGKNYDTSAVNPVNNTFLVKRARFAVKANINDHFSANFLVNFAELNAEPMHKVLENAFIKYTLNKGFNIQAGQFRPFFGIEDAVPNDLIRTLDYSNQYYAFGSNGWQSFQVGLTVFGDLSQDGKMPFRYYAGVYNGNNRNQLTDNDDTKDVYARLEATPVKKFTFGVNGARGSYGAGTGYAFGGDVSGKVDLSAEWHLLLAAEYKNGTSFTNYNAAPQTRPSISDFKMQGFYFFPVLRYEYKHPRVRAIEFSSRYEYFNDDYKRADNWRQTIIPNLSLIFADDFFASIQLGASIDLFKRNIPLTTTYNHTLFYSQFQVRF